MVLSTSEILTIGSGMQSQSISPPIRHVDREKPEEKPEEVPKCQIKYHKIRRNEKYKVTGVIPEYYKSDVPVPKTNIENLMKMTSKFRLAQFKIPDESNDYYIRSCYMIDDIQSPVRFKGEGTKAIKNLLEKSITDKDTEGRLVVDIKITDGQTSACGFFYKLGFRFIEQNKNKLMDNWLKGEKTIISPHLTGVMYLPQECVKRLLMYKMLL